MIKDADWQQRIGAPPERSRRRCRRRRSGCLTRFLAFVLVVAALAGWFWWQQNGLSSEEIEVASAPDGFAGYRIVLISDLHAKEFGAGNEKLIQYVKDLHPDLIAIVGDILHEKSQLAMIPAVASGLAGVAPTSYVTGNHEWAALERGGDRIALLGAEDSNGYADQKTIAELSEEVRQEQGDVYKILLSHRNTRIEEYVDAHIDLTLCGHAHGGLIRLPGTDGLIGPHREFFPSYTAGLYDLPYGQLVASRGLGNQFPAFRLFNRPDVPVVVLE